MRLRLIIALGVAALVSLFAAPVAAPTIHPIVSSECAAQPSQTGAGDLQNPPGQTPGGNENSTADFAAVSNAIPNSDGAALNGNSGVANCQNP
jgi:hypothetical protein